MPQEAVPSAATLRRLYVDLGCTQAQIGARLELTVVRVRAAMRAHGIPAAPQGRARWHALEDDALIRLYREDGLTARRIGRRFGVTDRTVLKRLRALGVPPHPPGFRAALHPWQSLSRADLVRLYWHEGKSSRDIARRYCICDRSVRDRMEKLHIPRRSPGCSRTPPAWFRNRIQPPSLIDLSVPLELPPGGVPPSPAPQPETDSTRPT